ncbi:MFS transporter [Nakamurella sp.]|uniref:MFS transporter n=1 Tax=Nakamurella sp. TaxID=1869182 RepID=UPI003B3B4882
MTAAPGPGPGPANGPAAAGRPGRLTAALFAGGIATFAELYAVQAVLPGLAAEFGLTESQATLAVSVATGALALSVLPWAAWGDRVGRARAMRASAIVAAISGLLVALAPTFTLLLVVRAISGAALGALPALAVAHLVSSAPPARVAGIGGLYIAGTTIGGLSGRVLTGAVGGLFGWRWGLVTTAVFVAVAAAVFAVLLDSGPRSRRPTGAGAGQWARVRLALADRVVWVFYAQAFLLMGAFVTVYNLLSFRLLGDPYRLPASVVSLLFLTYLVGTVSSSGVGRLVAALGRRRVLAGAGATMAVGAAITLAAPLWWILTGLILLTLSFFVAHAIAATWAGERVPAARSQASAVYSLAYYAGSSLVGLAGAALYARFGWSGSTALVVASTGTAAVVAFLGAPRPEPGVVRPSSPS